MSDFDTNIDNYTIPEMLTILDLDDPTEKDVIDATNKYIDNFNNSGNTNMSNFFMDMQSQLLSYMNDCHKIIKYRRIR